MALRSPSERCAVERPILMAGARDIFQNAVGSYKLFRLQIFLSSSLSIQSGIQKTRSMLVSRQVSRVERGSIQISKLEELCLRSTCEPPADAQALNVEAVLLSRRTSNKERRKAEVDLWTKLHHDPDTLSSPTASIVPEAEK